jgi:hypothetical protein
MPQDHRCDCLVRHEEGRMCSPSRKREFLNRLFVEWSRDPKRHFGQWLLSVTAGTDLDMIDDEVLLTLVEDYGASSDGMSPAEAEALSSISLDEALDVVSGLKNT